MVFNATQTNLEGIASSSRMRIELVLLTHYNEFKNFNPLYEVEAER